MWMVARHNDGQQQQGNPSWGPYLTVVQAQEWEKKLICATPTRAEWDRRADERKRAWEASPFSRSVARLRG